MQRIIYLPGHLFDFVKLALFPHPLSADYVFAYPPSFWDASNLLGFAVVAGLVAAGFVVYRHSKAISFGIGWFFITLLPVANLVSIYNPIAERYLYIPIVGLCLVVPTLFSILAGKWFARPAAATAATLVPMVGLLGVCAALTMARNPDWRWPMPCRESSSPPSPSGKSPAASIRTTAPSQGI